MTDLIEKIKRISIDLNRCEFFESKAKELIDEAYIVFKDITNITGYDMELNHMAAVPTSTGMALGLNHAAQCLLDYQRTFKFLKGISLAIRNTQDKYPNEVVNVFYAGCGPYAPFITLIAPLFDESKLKFSILEINGESLDLAKNLISELGQNGYVKNYYRADAVNFQINEPHKYKILVSETLDALLYRESYVPIIHNLTRQLNEEVIVIPNNVELKLSELYEITEGDAVNIKESPFGVILNTSDMISKLKQQGSLPDEYHTTNFKIETNIKKLLIDTEISIYNDLILRRGESFLSTPYEINIEESTDVRTMDFKYCFKPQIELKFDIEKVV